MSGAERQAISRQGLKQLAVDLALQALALDGPERQRALDEACADATDLLREVQSLLAQEEALDPDFLEQPLALGMEGHDEDSPSGELEAVPEQLGPYRILAVLGSGGMGTVYLAERDEPVRRRVALKVVGAHRSGFHRRFAAEGRALARLSHPNVASLYEVGKTGDGRSFIAMELVEGATITQWCDQRRLGLRDRLELFTGACHGVAHAHKKGILHRDLKPSNLLVTEAGGRAQAKVIDFGVAGALHEPLLTDPETAGGTLVGSPSYMSPETVAPGGRANADTRSDVYSLGLVLYELLVGILPFDTETTLFETFHRLRRGEEAVTPSRRFAEVDAGRRRELAALRRIEESRLERRLRGDLDAITGKAIAYDRERRYESPSELAGDLERHLRKHPIEARRPRPAYLVGRFLSRHVVLVVSAALVILTLSAGIVTSAFQARRASRETERVRAALSESREVSSFFVRLFDEAEPGAGLGGAVTARELLDRGAERLHEELADQPLARGRLLHTLGEIYTELALYSSAEELVVEALEIRRAELGESDPERVASLNQLRVIYRHRNRRVGQAEPVVEIGEAQAE